MNKNILKKLAKSSIVNGKIEKNIVSFVINKLSKKDIKIYLFHLRNDLKKRQIYVTISSIPSGNVKKDISEIFKNREIIYSIDDKLGAGMEIKYDDNYISISVKKMIEQAISKIEERL